MQFSRKADFVKAATYVISARAHVILKNPATHLVILICQSSSQKMDILSVPGAPEHTQNGPGS